MLVLMDIIIQVLKQHGCSRGYVIAHSSRFKEPGMVSGRDGVRPALPCCMLCNLPGSKAPLH